MPQPSDLDAEAEALDRLVEHWFFDTFHGSVAARTTEVWNHAHGAKEELKRRLAAFLAEARIP